MTTWIDKEKLHEAACKVIEDISFYEDPELAKKNYHRIEGVMLLLEKIENMMDAEETK